MPPVRPFADVDVPRSETAASEPHSARAIAASDGLIELRRVSVSMPPDVVDVTEADRARFPAAVIGRVVATQSGLLWAAVGTRRRGGRLAYVCPPDGALRTTDLWRPSGHMAASAGPERTSLFVIFPSSTEVHEVVVATGATRTATVLPADSPAFDVCALGDRHVAALDGRSVWILRSDDDRLVCARRLALDAVLLRRALDTRVLVAILRDGAGFEVLARDGDRLRRLARFATRPIATFARHDGRLVFCFADGWYELSGLAEAYAGRDDSPLVPEFVDTTP
jgi:hypothetical protein